MRWLRQHAGRPWRMMHAIATVGLLAWATWVALAPGFWFPGAYEGDEIVELRRSVGDLESAVGADSSFGSSLRDELDELASRISTLESETEELRDSVGDPQAASLASDIEDVSGEVEDVRSDLDDLGSDLSGLCMTLDQVC